MALLCSGVESIDGSEVGKDCWEVVEGKTRMKGLPAACLWRMSCVSLLLPILPTSWLLALRTCPSMPFYFIALPHHRHRNNGSNQQWMETSETELKWTSQVLITVINLCGLKLRKKVYSKKIEFAKKVSRWLCKRAKSNILRENEMR